MKQYIHILFNHQSVNHFQTYKFSKQFFPYILPQETNDTIKMKG